MSKFLGGFALASALWGGLMAFAYFGLGLTLHPVATLPSGPKVADAKADASREDERPRGRRRRRHRPRGGRAGGRTPTGVATTGDDLGENDVRNVDMGASGGEQQLSPAQIERGFSAVMPRIRRCFILAAGDDPVTGRLTFGLRIAPTGRVQRVRLTGPRAVTTSEAGTCLRTAARGARFDSFDGPPMIANYPITLE